MEKTLGINEQCFIRSQSCGRVYGGSRTCFIACPTTDELQLEIDVIKSVLRDNNIEPYVAVENFEPGKDIFCEKICAKIIESQFSAVLLSDVIYGGKDIATPNPNVYYEYGLMVVMHKTIIPLQKQDTPLAFNIQNLDTLTYTPKTLRGVFQAALKGVLGKSSEPNVMGQKYNCLNLFKRLSELENNPFFPTSSLPDTWVSILSNTVFELRRGLAFVADFTNALVINTVLSETRILLNHLANEIGSLQEQISKAADNPTYAVSFGVTVPYAQNAQTPLFNPSRSKGELESELETVKSSDILVIMPKRWIEEATLKYSEIEHDHKPKFLVINEEEIIARAVEAGLVPSGDST